MKTQVQQSSLEAFDLITTNGSKITQEQRVLGYLRSRPTGAAINEIARDLGIKEHIVSARLNGLAEEKLSREGHLIRRPLARAESGRRRMNPVSKVRCMLWFPVWANEEIQPTLF